MPDEVHPQPSLVEIAIEPKSKADQERLAVALAKLAADILKRIYKVEANIGAPQVAYREKIARATTVDYMHKKQTGGSGQFARVKIVAEPLPPESGFAFENKVVGGSVPQEFIPGVEKGLESVLGSGVLAGFPVVDLKVSLIDGVYHEVDSSALAFEIAARMALREALHKGGSAFLEPIMKVEVEASYTYAGGVIRDLRARRGVVQHHNADVVDALVPLANMFGYQRALDAISGGRARFRMEFDHYEPVPPPKNDDDPPFRPAIGMRA